MSIPDPVVLLDARAKYVHPAFQTSRASTKYLFDDAGVLRRFPANAIGWERGRGYVCEPTRENLLTWSTDLTQWVTQAATVTPNAGPAPDGSGTMSKLVETAGLTNQKYITQTVDGDGPLAFSCFARSDGSGRDIWVGFQGGGSATGMRVSLADGSIIFGADELLGFGLVPVGLNTYFLWVSLEASPGMMARIRISQDGNYNYEGDGESGVYIWGLQAEEGAFPTSYIPTEGATELRPRDPLLGVGDARWWANEQGTLLVEYSPFVRVMENARFVIFVRGASGGYAGVRTYSSNPGLLVEAAEGTTQVLSAEEGAELRRRKLALSWQDRDGYTVAVDGLIRAQVASSDALLLDTGSVGIGARDTGSAPGCWDFQRVVYYPERLSDADLQSLTAIQE